MMRLVSTKASTTLPELQYTTMADTAAATAAAEGEIDPGQAGALQPWYLDTQIPAGKFTRIVPVDLSSNDETAQHVTDAFKWVLQESQNRIQENVSLREALEQFSTEIHFPRDLVGVFMDEVKDQTGGRMVVWMARQMEQKKTQILNPQIPDTGQNIHQMESQFAALRKQILDLKQQGRAIANVSSDTNLEVVDNGSTGKKWWMCSEKKHPKMNTLLIPFNWENPEMVDKVYEQYRWLEKQVHGHTSSKDRLQVIGQQLNIDWRLLAAFMDSVFNKDGNYLFTFMTRYLESEIRQRLGEPIPDTFAQIKILEEEKKKLGEVNKKLEKDNAALFASHNVFDLCFNCGKGAKTLLKCTKCLVAKYCSKACQEEDWKKIHKKTCVVAIKTKRTLTRAFIMESTCTNLSKEMDVLVKTNETVQEEKTKKIEALEAENLQLKEQSATDLEEKMKKIEALEAENLQLKQESMEQTNEIASLKAAAGDPSKYECCLCMEEMIDTTLDPCGHMMCKNCAFQIINGKKSCPFCKCAVTRTFQMYNP